MNSLSSSLLVLWGLCALFALTQVQGQIKKGAVADIYNRIYEDLNALPCTRLLNATHQVGCNGPKKAVTGYLRLVSSQSSLDKLVASPPKEPFAPVIPASLVSKANMEEFGKMSYLIGVVVSPGQPQGPTSPAPQSPNSEVSLYPNPRAWNPNGDNLINVDVPFPVWAVWSNDESSKIVEQALENNEKNFGFPRWAVEFRSFMQARENSRVCISKQRCQPLGGYNVWMSIPLLQPSKPSIYAMASFTAGAFFHDYAVGADARWSGTAALLAASAVLQQRPEMTDFPSQVVFIAMDAETFSLTGSRKLVHDIKSPFQCNKWSDNKKYCRQPYQSNMAFTNMSIADIMSIYEVGQVGWNNTGLYTHHTDDSAQSATLAQTFTGNTPAGIPVRASTVSDLPPSSLHSFLKEKSSIPHVLVTDYDTEYSNQYYGSRFDEYSVIDTKQVCAAATALARSLYKDAVGTATGVGAVDPATLSANCTEVDEIMSCLTRDWNCELRQRIWKKSPDLTRPVPPHYTSVYQPGAWQLVTTFIIQYFNHYVEGTANDVNIHDVHDPGFEIAYDKDGYYYWTVQDESQPLWTESDWPADIGIRTFLQESYLETVVLGIFGITSIGLTGFATYYVRKFYRAHIKEQ